MKDEILFCIIVAADVQDMHMLDAAFLELAKKVGWVLTSKEFEQAFNDESINTNTDILRIIKI